MVRRPRLAKRKQIIPFSIKPMDNIIIVSSESTDLKVLHDLLKAQFPGVQLKHFNKEDEVSLGAKSEKDLNTIELCIKRNCTNEGFDITLKYRGRTYKHSESDVSKNFMEEDTNRSRRVLRLAVFRVVCQLYNDIEQDKNIDNIGGFLGPSPWGVLTGVRPTKIVHRLIEQGFSEEMVIRSLVQDYGIRTDKARLVYGTAIYQQPYLLKRAEAKKRISIYICIPFCPTRCYYCSFPSYGIRKWGHLLDRYLDALEKEIAAVGAYLTQEGLTVQSLYFGGGTPTVLSTRQLDRLLKHAAKVFTLENECEITVEGGRPDTLDYDKILIMRENKVYRLSINPQTMCDKTLQAVGRQHSTEDILQTFNMARQIGMPIINMDLIIGLPGEDGYVLKQTLDKVIELQPENITLHALAIKRAAIYRQENVEMTNWREGQAMMVLAHDCMAEAGYTPYYLYRQKDILAHGENVGYTLEGKACIYNIQMIEEKQTIIGLGVGAGSKIIDLHNGSIDNIYNPKDLLMYQERLEEIISKKVDKLKGFVYNNF